MSRIFSFASTNKITVVTKYEDREFTSYSFLQNIEPTLTTSASFQPLWKWNLQNNNNSIPLQFFTHIITSNNSDLYLILILIYPDSISFTSYDISKRTTFLGAINSNSYSFIESIVDIIYDNSTKYFILSSSSSSSHLMSSFLIPEHGKDHSIQLNNLFLKIDNTKKYIHHESILYTKIYSLSSPSTSTSSTSYLALISRSI